MSGIHVSPPDDLLREGTLLCGSQAGTYSVQDRVRIQAYPEKAHHDCAENCPYAKAHIRQPPMMRIGTLECALTNLQAIESSRKKTQRCYDGEADVRPIRSEQDEEFTHEIAESWKPERGHGEYQTRTAQGRHCLP